MRSRLTFLPENTLFQPVSKLIRRNSFTGRALHNKFLTDRSSATRFLAFRLSTDRTYVEFSLCCAFLSPEQTAVCALYVCIHNGNYSNFSPYSPKKIYEATVMNTVRLRSKL